jgi:hypothetical protein
MMVFTTVTSEPPVTGSGIGKTSRGAGWKLSQANDQRFPDKARLISNAISKSLGLSVLSSSTISSLCLGMR